MAKRQRQQTVGDWKRVLQMDYFWFEVLRPRERTCVREIKKKCMLEECLIPSVYYGRGKVMNGMGYCRVGRVKELY